MLDPIVREKRQRSNILFSIGSLDIGDYALGPFWMNYNVTDIKWFIFFRNQNFFGKIYMHKGCTYES